MSVSLTPHELWIPCVKDSHDPAKDLGTSSAPVIWRGTDVNLHLGLFIGASLITDKSNITAVYAEIHLARSGPALVQKTVVGSTLDVTVTEAQWAAKTHKNCTIALTAADTQVAMVSDTDDKRVFWLVIHAVDTSGKRITWGCAQLTVEEDGAQNDLDVVPMSNPAFRVSNGELQLWNPDQSKWQSIWIRGLAGQEQMAYSGGVT